MGTGIQVLRSGDAFESPMTFIFRKTNQFGAEGGHIEFVAEVWCSDKDIRTNIHLLSELATLEENKDTNVITIFATSPKGEGRAAHAGRCEISINKRKNSDCIAHVQMISVPPGVSDPELYDHCTVHFNTTLESIGAFVEHLKHGCESERMTAALEGSETFQDLF